MSTIRVIVTLLSCSVTALTGCDRASAGSAPQRTTSAAVTTPAVNADSARADSIARARQDSINRAQPGYIVDSILPVGEEMRRFRAAIGGDSATGFTGGSASRDALVRRFVASLAANDTMDLHAMAVTPREFIDLYYPESRFTHPPYEQSPSIAWTLIDDPSASGLTRLIRRLGGTHLAFVSQACDPTPVKEGRNTLYTGCLVRLVQAPGDTLTKRYFGSIIERGGQYKFMSYTNQF